jgi:SAM-dependent methyltransferase
MDKLDSKDILKLSRGFMPSRIFLTAAELDIFTLLIDTPMTAEETASMTDCQPRGITTLLDALTSMGLLMKNNAIYSVPDHLQPFLSSRTETSLIPMAHHSSHMWNRWSQLSEIIRPKGAPQIDNMEAFIGAMHAIGYPLAEAIVQKVGAEDARTMLDIGGASGTYTMAFLRAFPALKVTLFDRPPVVELARKRLGNAGLLDRVSLVPGDFSADPLPSGYDMALLSAIIHQNDRKRNVDLYRNIHNALNPGGRIVIRDHVMSEDHTEPLSGAIFAINMLTGTPGGTFAFTEIKEDLEKAGFHDVRLLNPDTDMDGIVDARK